MNDDPIFNGSAVNRTKFLVGSCVARLRCFGALVTARRDSLGNLARPGIRRVLVVCYGNIYRSAFVGAYLLQRSIPGLEVRSAGLHPIDGRSVPDRHVDMSRLYGVDLNAHRSAVLTSKDLAWADLIVLMDRHNWQELIVRGADRERLVWLGTLDGGAIEIRDPYVLDNERAKQTVARLAACSARLTASLVGGAR